MRMGDSSFSNAFLFSISLFAPFFYGSFSVCSFSSLYKGAPSMWKGRGEECFIRSPTVCFLLQFLWRSFLFNSFSSIPVKKLLFQYEKEERSHLIATSSILSFFDFCKGASSMCKGKGVLLDCCFFIHCIPFFSLRKGIYSSVWKGWEMSFCHLTRFNVHDGHIHTCFKDVLFRY